MLEIHTKSTDSFINKDLLKKKLDDSTNARKMLLAKQGKGREFLGWVDLPGNITVKDLNDIESAAKQIRETSEYLVIVGIGGSYLGSRAVISSLSSYFNIPNLKILYAGHHLDARYYYELLEFLQDKDFYVNVISKSGTTTEPAIAFRLLKELVEKKYGLNKLKERIIATTDKSKGALKQTSDELGIKTFTIPDDVGGRFSVFTPVGLLPIAAAGLDISSFIKGASSMAEYLKNESKPESNPACYYAATRNALYETGKLIEIINSFNPKLHFIKEWWKQLFGESEGKEGKGIYPSSVGMTTDLHSMGQYLQEGKRMLFETLLNIESNPLDITIKKDHNNLDKLNFLAGTRLSEINRHAIHGTLIAHHLGGVPTFEIRLKELNIETIGELLYFFEFACGVSGYMLGVNPFDQPGVEEYKENMFALLGKEGYESKKMELSKYNDWFTPEE